LGGGWFNNDTINLGSNGLQTFQITAMMGKAISYNPRYIVVMAGTNDAIKGSINSQEIQESWNRICSDHRVIVTLTPPTSDFNLNLRLNEINSMIKKSCDKRPLVTLDALRDSNGLIDPKFTFDGVHLNHEGYRVWINELQKHNI
jgi:lysophospholipase L1-like esterase